jgi:hypothetical protein
MPAKQIIDDELKLLMKQKGKICITIILPLHNLTTHQKADRLRLEKAVKETCLELESINTDESKKIVSRLKNLVCEIKFNRSDKGIGIYVSEDMGLCFTFPFPVSENIAIDKNFSLRELLLKRQYSVAYWILYIDEKEVRLYTGKLNQLHEIRNGEFPMLYSDETGYEYQPPSRGSSLAGSAHVKSFEREKHAIEKIRHEAFIREADALLKKYLKEAEVLLLCGTGRYTSAFLNRTLYADRVISVLNGNYNRYDEREFCGMAWPSVNAYIYEKMVDEISEYNEKIGEGLAEEGIVPVWEAVYEGRGETLLVEKSYQVKGYLTDQVTSRLTLKIPKKNYVALEDAVNNLLEMMLEKNGRVVFTEDGMLSDHRQIALITRYRYL